MDLGKNHNIIRVGNRWHYRRRVPQDLLQAFDGKEVIKFSLKTNDVKHARQRRDVEDVKFNAKISELRNSGKPEAVAQLSFLSTEETKQLIREHVSKELAHFSKDIETGPPLTKAEREEIELNQLYELRSLKDGDVQAEEWMARAWDSLERKLDKSHRLLQASDAHFSFLLRGLLEIATVKVRQLNHDYSKGYVDPAFNPETKPQHTFEELAEDYLSHYKQAAKLNGRTPKAVDKVEQNVGLMIELVGPKTLLTAIDYDFTEQLKLRLATVPSNYKKIYPGKNVDQAIALAAASGGKWIAFKTQRQYLGAFANVLKRGKAKKWLTDVPVDLKPIAKDKIADKDKRHSFSVEQLKSFFAGPFYAAVLAGDQTVKARPGFEWRYWLPILALYSGMRGNEICQMLTTDVKQTAAGTWYFQVTETDDEEGETGDESLPKTVKTETSERMMPIHSLIQSLGFLDFVARRKQESGTDRIFAGIKPDKYGNLFSYPSKRFNEIFLLKEMTPRRTKRQSFHSFRHTWRNAMRQMNASPDTLQALGAWDQGGLTSDDYGELSQPDHQRQFMEAVKFGDLDLTPLKAVVWK